MPACSPPWDTSGSCRSRTTSDSGHRHRRMSVPGSSATARRGSTSAVFAAYGSVREMPTTPCMRCVRWSLADSSSRPHRRMGGRAQHRLRRDTRGWTARESRPLRDAQAPVADAARPCLVRRARVGDVHGSARGTAGAAVQSPRHHSGGDRGAGQAETELAESDRRSDDRLDSGGNHRVIDRPFLRRGLAG